MPKRSSVERSSGHVGFGRAHDDAHLAERPAGGGLFQNAAGDLFGFALHARRLDEDERGMGAARWGTLLDCADGGEAGAQRGESDPRRRA